MHRSDGSCVLTVLTATGHVAEGVLLRMIGASAWLAPSAASLPEAAHEGVSGPSGSRPFAVLTAADCMLGVAIAWMPCTAVSLTQWPYAGSNGIRWVLLLRLQFSPHLRPSCGQPRMLFADGAKPTAQPWLI